MTGRLPRRLLVLGLGRSAEEVVAYAAQVRAGGVDVSVTAIDEASDEAARRRAERFRDLGAQVVLGAAEVSGDHDLVVASPGIPPGSTLMRWATGLGVPVVSEIEFAWSLSCSPWVAVTGTNGKTTTTALIAHLLLSSGVPAEIVGNFGPPAIAAVDQAGEGTVLVAEVSSFQLSLCRTFHPRVAVLLNITPDHVDWHGSLESYAADKAKVFENMSAGDLAVVDVDDPGSAPWAETVAGAGVGVCRVSRACTRPCCAYVSHGRLVVERHGAEVDLGGSDELRIRGEHNVSNALAAAAAALGAGASVEGVREGLRTFEPIEHRLEPVADVRGVEYFNDSKATNPDAVLKALTAFDDRPLIVLLGGHNKGNPFDELAAAVSRRCRLAVLFGESLPEMRPPFEALGASWVEAPTMTEAVALAAAEAVAGEVVLLSPGCASFDEFTSYEHRGRVFKSLVADLAADTGA